MAEVDADHAAVGHDEDVVAVAMLLADPADRLQNAGADLWQRLAARRRAVERRSHPREVRIPLARADLLDGAPFPFAERQLAELGERDEPDPGAGERDLRGVERALHRAHVRRPHAVALTHRTPERFGLAAAEGGKPDVVLALEPSHLVPQGLPVARQQEPHAAPSASARARRRRASASDS